MISNHSQGVFFRDDIGLGIFGVLSFSTILPDNHSRGIFSYLMPLSLDNHSLETQHLWSPDFEIHSLVKIAPSSSPDFIVRRLLQGDMASEDINSIQRGGVV